MTITRQPSCDDPTEPSLLPVADAQHRLQQMASVITETDLINTVDAAGRVLADDLLSPIDVPSATNSAMDGFALHQDSIPAVGEAQLSVVGEAYAGRPYTTHVPPGSAVRVFTGAVMPSGTDTVVIQEHVALEQGTVRIDHQVVAAKNVRYAGEDLKLGDTVLKQGRQLTAADIGLLASLGIRQVQVRRKLRVAFFSTGDEVQPLDKADQEALPNGMVYDSNRHTLRCLLQSLGVDTIDLGIVRDTFDETVAALQRGAAEADAIVTSGGISAGEADYVTKAFHSVGDVSFWKIAMRPGRPLACGTIGEANFFGLPGNPVAVMVTFLAFVMPALKRRMGMSDVAPLAVPAQALSRIRKTQGRTEYQRGILTTSDTGQLQVELTGKQGAGRLSSMSIANCLIVLPDALDGVQAGDVVTVWPFAGLLP